MTGLRAPKLTQFGAVAFHVDAQATERDALLLQAKALLLTVFRREQDLAFRADNALPRSAARLVQRPSDLAGCAGITRCICDVAIGGDLPAWHTADYCDQVREHVTRVAGHARQCYSSVKSAGMTILAGV